MGRLLLIQMKQKLFSTTAITWSLLISTSLVLGACGRAPAAQIATRIPATAVPATPTTVVASVALPTLAVTAPPPAQITTATPAVAVIPVVYQIDPTQSSASFSINESLFGEPKTVVGMTSDLQGVITVTAGNPAGTQIGAIRINARELHTDEEMRDRALRMFILETSKDEYQFVTFEPTQIDGLAAQIKNGEPISISVTGNLKIRGVVKPVTFAVSVTPKGDAELSGVAHATITRTDFELSIPKVPGVADVTDEIGLEFAFVAKKQ